MKKNRIIFILILLASCSSIHNKETENFTIDISKIQQFKDFLSLIDNYEFIRLKQDSLIGMSNKIIFEKNRIFIADRRNAQAIFIYNSKGKLINTISKLGRGVAEYTHLSDFNIDKLTDNIYILDTDAKKILVYNQGGKFISEIKLNFTANSFIIVGNKIIFDKFNMMERNGNPLYDNNILICDKSGKVTTGFLPIDEDLCTYSMGAMYSLWEYKGKISYLPPISNQIYTIKTENNDVSRRIEIDFGKNWPSDIFFKSNRTIHPAKVVQLMNKKKMINFLNCIENHDYICIAFYLGSDKIIGYLSKKDKTYKLFNTGESLFELLPLSVDEEGNFVNVIYPGIIKNWGKFHITIPDDIKNNKTDIVLFKYSFKTHKNEIE